MSRGLPFAGGVLLALAACRAPGQPLGRAIAVGGARSPANSDGAGT